VTDGARGRERRAVRNWQTPRVAWWAYTGMAIMLVAVQMVFVGNLVASLFWRRRSRKGGL
jgi:hypothetical protein